MPFDYTDPTPADVKADFAQFAAVDDAAIQRIIDRTPIWIDDGWLISDFTYAKEVLTAYYLTKSGAGSATNSEMAALGLSGVSRLKSASLDVTFKSSADSGDSDVPSPWNENVYGIEFYQLLRKNKSGPLTTGGCYGGIAGGATDMPWAYATGGWGL